MLIKLPAVRRVCESFKLTGVHGPGLINFPI